MFIDSHCHPYMLDLPSYDNNFDRFMLETKQAGVNAMLCVAVDMISAKKCAEIASKYENVYCSVGSHPSEKEEDDLSVETLCELAKHPKVVAIGETGLDYHYNSDKLEVMRQRFRDHISAAKLTKKPLIVHTRNASEDTLKIMRDENANEVGGVMHCFTESLEMAKASLDLNFYISFSGIITFKNAKELVEVARYVPLDKILIETDSPYLAPMPFRGKQNEPKYVRYVAEKIAEIKNISIEEVATATSDNFRSLFQIVQKRAR
ncbi:MAG: TatD family hydrolase [Gammaproteobacteria bacterium]|nr:TatD family hydrolase [Gammaproteobacteria bacterium]